ncbi:orotidine-5'-phosphate decarboxylase [Thermaerobacter litoralis]
MTDEVKGPALPAVGGPAGAAAGAASPAAEAAGRLIVALDVADADRAARLVDGLAPTGCAFKVGLEMLYALGPGWIDRLVGRGVRVFADAKLHDIPHTVFRAARALAARGAWMITVHVPGGRDMVRAALEGAAEGAAAAGCPRPLVVGVTVLTSLDEPAFREAAGAASGPGFSLAAEVMRRARQALEWGLDGVVCAPVDLAAVRAAVGTGLVLVTPGIRPAGAPAGDQRRVATPAEAVAAGADYLVVGRPVTAAADPVAALEAIAAQVQGAGPAAGGAHREADGARGPDTQPPRPDTSPSRPDAAAPRADAATAAVAAAAPGLREQPLAQARVSGPQAAAPPGQGLPGGLEQRIAGLLEQTGAHRRGHFRLTTGLHSDEFFLLAQAFQDPAVLEEVGAALAAAVRKALGAGAPVGAVVGPAMGGVLLAHAVARCLGARSLFAEKEPGGSMALKRGFRLAPGEPVLVVEDAVTTGGSVRKTMAAVAAAGGRVVAVGAVVDRSGGAVDFGVPFISLLARTVAAYEPDACPLCRQGVPLVDLKRG